MAAIIMSFDVSVTKIALLVSRGMNPDSWAQKLPIVLPTLRSLNFTWDVSDPDTDIAFPGLIKILEALTYRPNYISELFLSLFITRSDSDVLGLDWEVLDQVLADRSGFPRLEKLTLQLCSRCDWGNSENLGTGIQASFEKTKTTKFSRLFLAANDYLDFKFEAHDQ
jgi:hypothetical protein